MPKFSESLQGRDALIAILARREKSFGELKLFRSTKMSRDGLLMSLSMVTMQRLSLNLEVIKANRGTEAEHLLCVGFLSILRNTLTTLDQVAHSIVKDDGTTYSEDDVTKAVALFRDAENAEKSYFEYVSNRDRNKGGESKATSKRPTKQLKG